MAAVTAAARRSSLSKMIHKIMRVFIRDHINSVFRSWKPLSSLSSSSSSSSSAAAICKKRLRRSGSSRQQQHELFAVVRKKETRNSRSSRQLFRASALSGDVAEMGILLAEQERHACRDRGRRRGRTTPPHGIHTFAHHPHSPKSR